MAKVIRGDKTIMPTHLCEHLNLWS